MKGISRLAAIGLFALAWTAEAAGDVKSAIYTIDEKDCKPAKITNPGKVHKKSGDILLLTFSNACGRVQHVQACAKPKGSGTALPINCNGYPKGKPAAFAAPFELKPGTTASPWTGHVACDVEYPAGDTFDPQKFCLYVDSGDSAGALACPPAGAVCGSANGSRGLEISIEVEP